MCWSGEGCDGIFQILIWAGIILAFIFWIVSWGLSLPASATPIEEAIKKKAIIPPPDPKSVAGDVRREFEDLLLLFQNSGGSSSSMGGRAQMPADPEIIRLWISNAQARVEAKIDGHDAQVTKLIQYVDKFRLP